MNTKTCNRCEKDLPLSEYQKASRNRDGLQHTCKSCRAAADRQRYKTTNKKQKIRERVTRIRSEISDYKHERGCACCDETEPVALDFHHPNDDKEFNIGQQIGLSEAKIWEEIAKCVVVCANCHRKIHANILASPTE